MSWSEVDLEDPVKRSEAVVLARQIAGATADSGLYHDLDWLLSDKRNRVRALFFDGDDGRGYLPLLVQDRPLSLMLGEVTLVRIPLTRLTVQRGPLLECAPDRCETVLAELVHVLLETMPPGVALNVEGIPEEGAFLRVLEKIAIQDAKGRLMRLGPAFMHQYIDMPASFDKYLAQMSKRSRKSIQYSKRKLEKQFGDAVLAKRFDTVEAVTDFLKDATLVSRQTYQWHLLGLGLRDSEGIAATLRTAAERGIFRSYILYCGSEPVAFMLGYLHRGTYHYVDVGYVATWRDWSVGSVLQLMVLEDLYAGADPPRLFDFSTGYGEHKGRFGNMEERQANVLLMTRTLRASVATGSYMAMEKFSNTVVNTLDRFGWKEKIKRAIRRGSVKKVSSNDTAD